MKHTLAVVLYADVVGYSRLSGVDEDATVTLLRSTLNLFTSLIETNDGKKIKEAGDAILAEFGSAVSAVETGIIGGITCFGLPFQHRNQREYH